MSDLLLALALGNPYSYHTHPEPLTAGEREAQAAKEAQKQNRTDPTPSPANGATKMSTQTHTNAPHPRTIGELWPSKWLKPEDLKRPAAVAIVSVDWPEVWDPSQKQNVIRPALRFSYRKADGTTIELDKRLILNKTQAISLAKITGSEELDRWVGANVVLSAGRAHTGAATIVIGPAPKSANGGPQVPLDPHDAGNGSHGDAKEDSGAV